MKTNSLGMSLFLTALVLPGMGQWYLQRKLRGTIFALLALLIVISGFARYMAVLFALANVRGTTRPPSFHPFHLMAEAWRMDHRVLWAFVIALVLVWLLAIVDVLLIHRKVIRN